jgi:hypothetical protein
VKLVEMRSDVIKDELHRYEIVGIEKIAQR